MKKLKFIIVPLLYLVACSNPNQPVVKPAQDAIIISDSENTSPVFATEGGEATISFTTTNVWTASVINTRADGWCSISPTSGSAGTNIITIKTAANESNEERNASIRI